MKKTSFLDTIQFNIVDFFTNAYTEIGTEDTPAISIIDYEVMLLQKEFAIFDCVRLRVLFDKLIVENEPHINASFFSKNDVPSLLEENAFIHFAYAQLGKDSNNIQHLSIEEIPHTIHATWLSNIGDCFFQIIRTQETQLEFNILFINNILKQLQKKIIF